MARRHLPGPGSLPRRWAIAIAFAIVVALFLPRFFAPDPTGLGTHEQLGLPPCVAVTLLGIPCPTCGCTTAWAFMARGQPLLALRSNAFGVALYLLFAFGSIALASYGLRGNRSLVDELTWRGKGIVWGLAALLALSWAIKVATWRVPLVTIGI